jgi:hypothetical protein
MTWGHPVREWAKWDRRLKAEPEWTVYIQYHIFLHPAQMAMKTTLLSLETAKEVFLKHP